MPRKTLIRSKNHPYHVTARANNREEFHLPLHQVWKVLNHDFFEANLIFKVEIHALVLMPNHFHLLITAPEEDLGMVMQQSIRSITKTLNLKSGRSGRVFGSRYHWTLIDSHLYFAHALKYVYRNPVKAKLSEKVEDYEFSTLSGLLGAQPLAFPLYFPFGMSQHLLVPERTEDMLSWLNTPFQLEHEAAVKKALRKTRFAPPKQGWKRSLEVLKSHLL